MKRGDFNLRSQRSQVRILSGAPFVFNHLQTFCSLKNGQKWPLFDNSEKFLEGGFKREVCRTGPYAKSSLTGVQIGNSLKPS